MVSYILNEVENMQKNQSLEDYTIEELERELARREFCLRIVSSSS